MFGAAFCDLTLALKSNAHPWLRVVQHVGISVIFNGRCHTQEAELRCYAFVTMKLYPNSYCKRYEKKRILIYRRIWCLLSLKTFKYSVTPPTEGW